MLKYVEELTEEERVILRDKKRDCAAGCIQQEISKLRKE